MKQSGRGGGTRSETTKVGFVKQVDFKPGVKERELWMSRVVNKIREEVMGEGIS